MPPNEADQIDYMAEEGYMSDFVDDVDGDENGGGDQNIDDYDMLTKVTDTSSAQARTGKDIQGIPWERLNITRESYRRTRLEQYRNYENIPLSGDAVDKKCKQKSKGGNYYEFFHNTRSVKPTILHFQLRNLVWATSKHDVYLMSNYSIMHWSSLSQNLNEILNFSGHVAPTEKHAGSLLEGFTQTQISTLAVNDDFLVAGGFQGELACKRLDKQGVSFCTRTTYEDNAITNAIEIYKNVSGGMHFMASNNDCGVREYDMEGFQLVNHFRFPWPVNHTSLSPDRKLITVVGDHLDGLLVDSASGKTVATVEGHLDYSFASAWHPDGKIFATGNQDKTCRVWDLRNLSNPVSVLKGNMGAVRSVRFSSDGQFLVVAEPADFVHVYNTNLNYEKRQEIDFFGEISGVSLSPDDETLYIGVWDRTYASLLQFNKRHKYGYLDLLFSYDNVIDLDAAEGVANPEPIRSVYPKDISSGQAGGSDAGGSKGASSRPGKETLVEEDVEVDIEGDDEDDATFVPAWSVKKGTRMNNANVCRDMMINLATPGEEKYLDSQDDSDAVRRSWLLLGKSATAQADVIFRFESLLGEHQKLTAVHGVCEKTFAENWKKFGEMSKELEKVKDEHAECVKVNPEGIQKLRSENASLEDRVSQLEMEKEEWRKVSGDQADKIKLLEARLKETESKLGDEEKSYRELCQEKQDLAIAAGNAEVDRNRIVNEFIPEAIRRLLGSHEFRTALAEPFNLYYQSGLIDGAGLFDEPEKAAKLLGEVEGIDMEADEKYQVLYDQALSQDYPFFRKIRQAIDRKYDELMALVPDPAPASELEGTNTSGAASGSVIESQLENPSGKNSSDQNASAFV